LFSCLSFGWLAPGAGITIGVQHGCFLPVCFLLFAMMLLLGTVT
jgi:hypothetical protein